MSPRRRAGRHLAVVALVAAAFGLSACLGPPPPPTPPPPAPGPPPAPTTSCTAGAQTLPPPIAESPLHPAQAGAKARAAIAESETRNETGAIPLVTVEETAAGSEITVTPVSTADEAAAVAEAAATDGDLVTVEVDVPVHAIDHPPSNDPDRPQQWALDNVPFEHAAANAAGGDGQTVAVIDTGVQGDHPDLSGQVLVGQYFLRDAHGNPISGSGGNTDDHGHGTHVGGIISATANNLTGITGAAPNVEVLPVKVLDGNGSGWSTDVAKGIEWASDNGATVINLSLGSGGSSMAEFEAIQHARAEGVVVVASAGNDGVCGPASYPAAFPEVMAVGATASNNTRATFSTTGPYLDLAAPGAGILSTWNNGDYEFKSGTSMASPYVAAAAALVRAAHPEYTTHQQVCEQLVATADQLGAPSDFGHGLVDPVEAVGTTVATPDPSCS